MSYENGRHLAQVVCGQCHGTNLSGEPKRPVRPTPDLLIVAGYDRGDFPDTDPHGQSPRGPPDRVYVEDRARKLIQPGRSRDRRDLRLPRCAMEGTDRETGRSERPVRTPPGTTLSSLLSGCQRRETRVPGTTLLCHPRPQISFERLCLRASSVALEPSFQSAELNLVNGCRRLYGETQALGRADAAVSESTSPELRNGQRSSLKQRFPGHLNGMPCEHPLQTKRPRRQPASRVLQNLCRLKAWVSEPRKRPQRRTADRNQRRSNEKSHFGDPCFHGSRRRHARAGTPVADVSMGYSFLFVAKGYTLKLNGGNSAVAFNVNHWLGMRWRFRRL